ncbi:hypothetical protein H632_c3059p0, partial [Helicosporidium sp. ATCC 50920]
MGLEERQQYRLVRAAGSGQVHLRLHPSSVLFRCRPRWLLFFAAELHDSGWYDMRDVMTVEPEWLLELAPHMYRTARNAFSKSMTDLRKQWAAEAEGRQQAKQEAMEAARQRVIARGKRISEEHRKLRAQHAKEVAAQSAEHLKHVAETRTASHERELMR